MSAASPPTDARRRRLARLDTRTGYARLLRLRHVNPGFYLSLALFEGSVAAGVVLAFGEVINPWGAAAIPAAVAVMVKLNDVVAGQLKRPVAEAQLRRSRPAPVVAGRSPVPRPSRPTQWIDRDDAVPYEMPDDDSDEGTAGGPVAGRGLAGRGGAADSGAADSGALDGAAGGVARGVAAVPDARRPPAPGVPADDAAIAFDPAEPFELIGPEPEVELDPPGGTATGERGDPAAEWTGDERRERIGIANDTVDGSEPVADQRRGRLGDDAGRAGDDAGRAGDDAGRPGSEPPGRGNVGRFLR